jgi:hypothetical protein
VLIILPRFDVIQVAAQVLGSLFAPLFYDALNASQTLGETSHLGKVVIVGVSQLNDYILKILNELVFAFAGNGRRLLD